MFTAPSPTYILKISRKSIHPFFRNVASSQTDRKTDRPTDKRENITFAGRGDEKQMHISDLTEHISQEVYQSIYPHIKTEYTGLIIGKPLILETKQGTYWPADLLIQLSEKGKLFLVKLQHISKC